MLTDRAMPDIVFICISNQLSATTADSPYGCVANRDAPVVSLAVGLKRTDKANKAERLCFDSPFERRPGVSLTAGVVE